MRKHFFVNLHDVSTGRFRSTIQPNLRLFAGSSKGRDLHLFRMQMLGMREFDLLF